MRRTTVMVLLFTGFALAKDKKPADYPLTAHVIAVNQYTNFAATGEEAPWTAQFRVGEVVYATDTGCHKYIHAGEDVRGRVQKDTFYVLTDAGKSCDVRTSPRCQRGSGEGGFVQPKCNHAELQPPLSA